MGSRLFDTNDPLGRRIVLEEQRWLRHIVGKRHPELAGQVGVVQLTVEHPQFVLPSRLSPSSNVYLRLGASPVYPGLYVKVPVSFHSGFGIVSSAWLTDDMLQGVDEKGKVIYADYHR